MKILILTRFSFFSLSGGDKIQVLKTKLALERLGHEVTVSNQYVRDIAEYDIVHLFNIQINPHTFMIFVEQAKRSGKPVALSPVYWNPTQWKSNIPEGTDTGVKSVMTNRFPGIPKLALLGYFFTSATVRQWFWLMISRPGSGAALRFVKNFVVTQSNVILPNGLAEQEQVGRDLGRYQRSIFVPNGVDDDFKDADPQQFISRYGRQDFVLSVGRIETRKNTLALARACRKLGLPLVLIGNDQLEAGYVEVVRREGPADLLIIPEMPYQDLGSAYKSARVHAMVSWFETPGLSSLEAAVAGCNIVSTEIGTAREYFGDDAWYCNPADDRSIEDALSQAVSAPQSSALREHILANFTWEVVARTTTKAYQIISEAAK